MARSSVLSCLPPDFFENVGRGSTWVNPRWQFPPSLLLLQERGGWGERKKKVGGTYYVLRLLHTRYKEDTLHEHYKKRLQGKANAQSSLLGACNDIPWALDTRHPELLTGFKLGLHLPKCFGQGDGVTQVASKARGCTEGYAGAPELVREKKYYSPHTVQVSNGIWEAKLIIVH